ncbi:MAG TPA: DUF3108 domain-containing protein [Gemmatimonadaceae bacterium]|jgi:hypothetical protein
MLLPLLSAVLVAFSSTNAGAIRAASEDSLRCAPGERRIEIAAGADRRPGYPSDEQLVYSAYYGKLRVGTGEMRLAGRDTVRGLSAWKAMFIIDGGIPGARLHDTTVTWFDSVTFNSMRFVQNVHDPGYHADRDTHIFPDDKTYRTKDGEIHPSVADPLDDMSLVYLVRTLPLEPGQCYVLSRYFKPESNPVVVHVVRRDTVEVPAGRFPAILLRPEIKTTGIFSQNGHAELWLADDSARTVLQLRTSLKFGSISLRLRHVGRAQ